MLLTCGGLISRACIRLRFFQSSHDSGWSAEAKEKSVGQSKEAVEKNTGQKESRKRKAFFFFCFSIIKREGGRKKEEGAVFIVKKKESHLTKEKKGHPVKKGRTERGGPVRALSKPLLLLL